MRVTLCVLYVVSVALATVGQPVSYSILHHIDVLALSHWRHGRRRDVCLFRTDNTSTRETVYDARGAKWARRETDWDQTDPARNGSLNSVRNGPVTWR